MILNYYIKIQDECQSGDFISRSYLTPFPQSLAILYIWRRAKHVRIILV